MVMNKEKRHQVIAAIVQDNSVTTQGELLAVLEKKGMRVNQATLSRDLAEVGIRKSGGRYIFANNNGGSGVDPAPTVRCFMTCGPHMVVVRTAIGQAQAVAVQIDGMSDPSFAGTVAGDDTIFIATKNRRTQAVAIRRLKHWFGDKHEH
jgi:transcriptional regulator of arginine metabolism